MLGRARGLLRQGAYAVGALGLRHHRRNAATLTVAMFHRVVAPGSPAAIGADPNYSLSAPLFAACLDAIRRHYAVIGLPDLLAALGDGPPLPPRAMLLTFDDGWRDNMDVAAPILARAGLPAVLFAATDAITDSAPRWWQEVLLRALRDGRAGFDPLWSAAGGGPPPDTAAIPPELHLLLRYGALAPAERVALLAPLETPGMAAEGRHMLDAAGLDAIAAAGFAIGAHGATHLPLSMLADPGADLARARAALAAMRPGVPVETLSFPHGRYHEGVLRAARAAEFRVLFTSDACLNAAPGGRPGTLLGRINIVAAAITDATGALDPARLATWLFNRPITRLAEA
ncbi:MAG: polysaccharide deacetylase family protein [Acetobacteraceae bacterium]|nr:polysaccharide deacetylase family protein [Acetobacteraceae bacterium]